MTGRAPEVVSLDHVALAVPDIDEALDLLRSRLGATIISGDEVPGYRFAMTRVGDAEAGMNLEILEPRKTEEDDFLVRFLQRRGAGVHHLTFLQRDIAGTVAALRDRGYRMVRTRLDFGPWQESFIHPSHGCGTVVQLAGSTVPVPPMPELLAAARDARRPPPVPYDERSEDPFWWARRHPPGAVRRADPAVLERIVVGIVDPGLVRELYVGVLGGEVVAERGDGVEVAWGSSGRILFVQRDHAGVEALELSRFEGEFSMGSARFRPLRNGSADGEGAGFLYD